MRRGAGWSSGIVPAMLQSKPDDAVQCQDGEEQRDDLPVEIRTGRLNRCRTQHAVVAGFDSCRFLRLLAIGFRCWYLQQACTAADGDEAVLALAESWHKANGHDGAHDHGHDQQPQHHFPQVRFSQATYHGNGDGRD